MEGKQLMVRPLLENFAMRQQNNLIGIANRGQAVRHNQHRADVHHLFE